MINKKLLHHPVISGLVVAATIAVASNLLGWWPTMWSWAKWGAEFLVSTYLLPVWLVALMAILSLLLLSLIVAKSLERLRNDEPSYYAYTEDEIQGVRWRWKYTPRGIRDLTPFCVECDFQISPRMASGYHAARPWEYRCENCQHLGIRNEGHYGDLEDYVIRQIQLKLRNGQWKQCLAGT